MLRRPPGVVRSDNTDRIDCTLQPNFSSSSWVHVKGGRADMPYPRVRNLRYMYGVCGSRFNGSVFDPTRRHNHVNGVINTVTQV